ncbi:MAG: hypothetical protein K6L76_09435 [Agarilytica sp.]
MKIDFDCIQREYQQALEDCDRVFPIKRWSHAPQQVKLTRHKTKYGMAMLSGDIYVSHAFIGTNAINKLRATIRHELAHLAVGLRHQHDKSFRQFEAAFGAKKKVRKEEMQEVHDNIPFKWQVIAHLDNGVVKDIGGAHRRSKRFKSYAPNKFNFMTVDGVKVERFEFVEN